jgi:hypothetical protein
MNKEQKQAYMKVYNATPEARAMQKRYYQTPKGKTTHRQGQHHYYNKIKGVYGCFDGETNECLYVGGSKAVNGRINNHRYATNNLDKAAKHRPSHLALYTALAQHTSRDWRVIEECEVEMIKTLEKHYISIYNPIYNIHNSDKF